MTTRAVNSIVFLLLDQFTLISLASALEPLRMANQLAGQELYRWHTASLDGHPVWASDGVPVTPDGSIVSVPCAAALVSRAP
jgi:AraC family transcriptional regulator, glycine betaine-responsive activator